jgi:hypothetical protein
MPLLKQLLRPGMFSFFFALILLIYPHAASAEVEVLKLENNAGIYVSGEITARHSYENWFQSATPSADNSFHYFFSRTRLGVSVRHPYVGAFVQAQDVRMGNLPENAVAPAPRGPLGIGAIYALHHGNRSTGSMIVRQAYVDVPRIFAKGLSARFGRFDYADGKEVMYGNPKVNWLKNMRLSERLIGPFDWSSYNRSFDGVQVAYDAPWFHLHSSFTHPTQGGFEKDAHKTISAIDLGTVTATIKYDQWLPKTEGRFFYYYYDDYRDITATPGQSGLNEGNIRINTFGTHWLKTHAVRPGVFDMLFWGALQNGDWGAAEHNAWSVAIEGGFQFTRIPWQPWIRGGYFLSSGDSDPEDGRHETFYQLLPTARKYSLFPFYNMMNNEDRFIQVVLRPVEEMTLRADLHSLRLHQARDLWYMGAGPTQKSGNIFGYIGRPSGNHRDLATVLEIVAGYTFSPNFSANLYYGHAFGKDVIENIYDGDSSGDFFSIEFRAQF